MAAQLQTQRGADALTLATLGYEELAKSIHGEAQRAAAYIPVRDFEDVFESAPEMEFYHKYVQSLLTWIWYEVHENEVPVENLPEPLGNFFMKYEGTFAGYWTRR